MNFRNLIAKHYINLRGWKTNRKIVVIESDDWGSIRMASKETYNRLLEMNIPVDKSYFTRNDSLETNEDIYILQDLLSQFKDKNNRSPVITLNTLVANPDFEKIKSDGFQKFSFKSIIKSYEENQNDSSNVLKIYKDSIQSNSFFKPQFHGREHLNVRKYMTNLQEKQRYDLLGLDFNCILGLTEGDQVKSRAFYHEKNYMAGFEALDKAHENEIIEITNNGLEMFKNIFEIKSESFVAQSLIWGDFLLPVLKNNGVKYIQGAQQFVPLGNGMLKVVDRFTGSKTVLNQLLWRRNASFEPSSQPNLDWSDKCLKEIELAFKWRTPVIINSHRVNFMGSINEQNRINSINQFKKLLSTIIKKWPDVEFYSSDELGSLMKK